LNIRLSKKTGGTNGDCAFSKAKLIDFSSDVIMMTITREVRTHRIHTKKKEKREKRKEKKRKKKILVPSWRPSRSLVLIKNYEKVFIEEIGISIKGRFLPRGESTGRLLTDLE